MGRRFPACCCKRCWPPRFRPTTRCSRVDLCWSPKMWQHRHGLTSSVCLVVDVPLTAIDQCGIGKLDVQGRTIDMHGAPLNPAGIVRGRRVAPATAPESLMVFADTGLVVGKRHEGLQHHYEDPRQHHPYPWRFPSILKQLEYRVSKTLYWYSLPGHHYHWSHKNSFNYKQTIVCTSSLVYASITCISHLSFVRLGTDNQNVYLPPKKTKCNATVTSVFGA